MSARRALLVAVFLAGSVALAAAPAVRADTPSAADLVRDLAGDDVTQRYAAYRSLLATRPPEALPLLAKAVPSMLFPVQSLGFSIVQGYPQADAKPVLERWMASDAPFLQVAAGAALLRQGEPKASAVIAKALARQGPESGTLPTLLAYLYGVQDERVLAAIRALLRPDAPADVVGAALFQLQGVEDEAARKPVEALLASGSASVRALAATWLLRMGDEAQAEVLAPALASGELPYADYLRVAALLARAPRCPEKVLDALVTLVGKAPPGYDLSNVLKLLGEYAHPKAAPVLQGLLDHENALVSKAAFDALSRIPGALTPEVTKSLLQSKDEARRISAAEALARRDDLAGLPVVIDVLRNGTQARADAARALGGFRARAAVEPLIDALLDADVSVRANAYDSLARVLPALFPYRRFDLASLGYVTTAAPDARSAAVGRLRAWWVAHKNGGW